MEERISKVSGDGQRHGRGDEDKERRNTHHLSTRHILPESIFSLPLLTALLQHFSPCLPPLHSLHHSSCPFPRPLKSSRTSLSPLSSNSSSTALSSPPLYFPASIRFPAQGSLIFLPQGASDVTCDCPSLTKREVTISLISLLASL